MRLPSLDFSEGMLRYFELYVCLELASRPLTALRPAHLWPFPVQLADLGLPGLARPGGRICLLLGSRAGAEVCIRVCHLPCHKQGHPVQLFDPLVCRPLLHFL